MSEILHLWFLVFLCRVTTYIGVTNQYIFHVLNFISIKLFCSIFFYSFLLLTLYLLDSSMSIFIYFHCRILQYDCTTVILQWNIWVTVLLSENIASMRVLIIFFLCFVTCSFHFFSSLIFGKFYMPFLF